MDKSAPAEDAGKVAESQNGAAPDIDDDEDGDEDQVEESRV